jgi:hypothetical protein
MMTNGFREPISSSLVLRMGDFSLFTFYNSFAIGLFNAWIRDIFCSSLFFVAGKVYQDSFIGDQENFSDTSANSNFWKNTFAYLIMGKNCSGTFHSCNEQEYLKDFGFGDVGFLSFPSDSTPESSVTK